MNLELREASPQSRLFHLRPRPLWETSPSHHRPPALLLPTSPPRCRGQSPVPQHREGRWHAAWLKPGGSPGVMLKQGAECGRGHTGQFGKATPSSASETRRRWSQSKADTLQSWREQAASFLLTIHFYVSCAISVKSTRWQGVIVTYLHEPGSVAARTCSGATMS